MRQGITLTYLHADALGSASLATTVTGTLLSQRRYLPYGETRWSSGPFPTDRRFTGQREEVTLGVDDYGARFYSPGLGRFLSADTLVPEAGRPQSLNRYAYVLGNPLRYTGPTGYFEEEAIKRYLQGQYGENWEVYWALWTGDTAWMNLLSTAEAGNFLVYMALDPEKRTLNLTYFQFNGTGKTSLTSVNQVDELGDAAQQGKEVSLHDLYPGRTVSRGLALIQMDHHGNMNEDTPIPLVGNCAFAKLDRVSESEFLYQNLAVLAASWGLSTFATKDLRLGFVIALAATGISMQIYPAGDNVLTVGVYYPVDRTWGSAEIVLRGGNMLLGPNQLMDIPKVRPHCWGCQ